MMSATGVLTSLFWYIKKRKKENSDARDYMCFTVCPARDDASGRVGEYPMCGLYLRCSDSVPHALRPSEMSNFFFKLSFVKINFWTFLYKKYLIFDLQGLSFG